MNIFIKKKMENSKVLLAQCAVESFSSAVDAIQDDIINHNLSSDNGQFMKRCEDIRENAFSVYEQITEDLFNHKHRESDNG